MRLKSFILMLIASMFACAGALAIHFQNVKFASDLAKNGLAGFGLVILIPIYFALYILTYGLTISSIINSIKSIGSENKFIKVISIIILILILVMIAFLVFVTSETIKFL